MAHNGAVEPMSRTMKKITMCAIWFCTFSFGLAYNFLPSALIELKNKFDTTIEDISKVFTVMLLAYLVGALTCGLLFNYVNRQLTVVAILCMLATGVVLIPYAPTRALFFSAGGLIGFASGGYDTSQVVWTLELWHGEAGVYIQAEYFAFALGTFVAPLLMKPFLAQEHSCLKIPANCSGNSSLHAEEWLGVKAQTDLYIPALVSGAIVLSASSIIFVLFCFKRYEPPQAVQSRKNSFNFSHSEQPLLFSVDVTAMTRRGNLKRISIIALCAAFLGCYQGMEVCTLQFIPTFSHYIALRLSEADGAAVLSAVTGAFTVGRFLGILACIFRAKPVAILCANLLFALAGNIVLLLAANSNMYALDAGGILLGLGYSAVFACVYDYIERHVRVTNIVSAVMVVSGSIVGAIYPLVVGDSVEQRPFVLMETIFFSLGMCAVTFFGIYALTCGDDYDGKTSTEVVVDVNYEESGRE